MGARHGTGIQLRLSLAENDSRSGTERALNLLGWTSRRDADRLIVELATEAPWARPRDLACALGADVAAMQENLQSGKSFALEIPDEDWQRHARGDSDGDAEVQVGFRSGELSGEGAMSARLLLLAFLTHALHGARIRTNSSILTLNCEAGRG